MRNREIKKHYQSLFANYGVSEKAVQYSDKVTQWARFACLVEYIQKDHSILDLGCGLGHFFEFMKKNNFTANYCGADIVGEFILNCQERFSREEKVNFVLLDDNSKLPRDFDFIIVSGMFNNKRYNNEDFMLETIRNMFEVCNVGIAFNAMSKHVDYEEEHLYYTDPEALFTFAKSELGGYPVLNHSYKLEKNAFPHDYTLTIFKEPQLPSFII